MALADFLDVVGVGHYPPWLANEAEGDDECADDRLRMKPAISVDYKLRFDLVVDDPAARPSLIFSRRNNGRVAESTKLTNAEATPALPLLVMTVGMGEAVAIELGLR